MRAALLRCGLVVGPIVEYPPGRPGARKKTEKLCVGKYSRQGGLVLLQSAGMEEWDSMEWRPRSGKHLDGVTDLDIIQFFEVPAPGEQRGEEGGRAGT